MCNYFHKSILAVVNDGSSNIKIANFSSSTRHEYTPCLLLSNNVRTHSTFPKPHNKTCKLPSFQDTPGPEQPSMSFFKRLKVKRVEPSLALGFFVITIVCSLCYFFYLDYGVVTKGCHNKDCRAVTKGYHNTRAQKQKILGLNIAGGGVKRIGFLDEGGEGCGLFDGNWVWDEKYPLYQSVDCPFIGDGFNCKENGRPDDKYSKWRWQPNHCNLPRFDAKVMLEKLRNRRLVFVGDSIGRNQWVSLLCLLSSAVPDKSEIYEVSGSPITKLKGSMAFKFKDYNCTVEFFRAPFLVLQSRPPAKVPVKVKATLKLDQMDWSSVQWRDADILVFNTGHWWNFEKTIRAGCYFQERNKVKEDLSVGSAYERSIRTVLKWVDKEVDMNKTQVIFRTYAPVHFRGGDWRTGGNCHLETLPELNASLVPSQTWAQHNIVNHLLSAHSKWSRGRGIDVLDVTHMSALRKDGHSSLYYLGPDRLAPLHRQDCSHWCLPGVPDVWNELLYSLFLKREGVHHQNLTYTKTQSVNKGSIH